MHSSVASRLSRRYSQRLRARLIRCSPVESLELRRLLSGVAQNAAQLPDDLPVAHTTYQIYHPAAGEVTPFSSLPTGSSPTQIRHAYGIDQITFSNGTVTGDGSGQTIAIVDAYDNPRMISSSKAAYTSSDLWAFNNFYSSVVPQFGGTGPTFTKVNQSGNQFSYPPADLGWAGEIALDVEWSHVIAPNANILLVEAASSGIGDLATAASYAASVPGVVAVSMSFGSSEFSTENSLDSTYDKTGVTFFASTGDTGAPAGYPAYSPNVVAVGGTHINFSGNDWFSETGWGGSGGGVSTQETKPGYQSSINSINNPGISNPSNKRMTPDVAFDADPNSGVPVYDALNNGTSSPWVQVGGTSLSSPCFAAIGAIIAQGRAINGFAQYNSNSFLTKAYSLSSSDFHDITSGNNGLPCLTGYDLVTGRGSPIATALVADMVGVPLGPSAPTNLNLPAVSDTGISNADRITKIKTPLISGNAAAGTTINLFDAAVQVGTTTTDSNGKWSIICSALADGTHALQATATDAGGTSGLSSALSITIDTVAPVQGAPNLAAASDSGISNSDKITKIITPTFTGTTEAGATLVILSDGTQVASSNVGAINYSLATSALADGTHQIAAKAIDVAGNVGAPGPALAVTIDTTAPTVSSATFNYDTAQDLTYTFSESVSGLALGGLSLLNTTTNQNINLSVQFTDPSPGAVVTFPLGVLPDGTYTATINAGAVMDVAGNSGSMRTDNFFFLDADASHDGTVNLIDFNALATGFGNSGATFSGGDFNYDGVVDTLDFAALAARFDVTLPVAASPIAASPAAVTSALAASSPSPAVMPKPNPFSGDPIVDASLIDVIG